MLGDFKLVHSRRVSYRLKPGWSKNKYLAGDALVAVSQEICDVLIDSGIPEDKTYTFHSGIDAEMYSTDKHPHPVLTVGAVGALSTQKGFEVLIEALAELKKDTTMPDWQCLIAGDGPLFRNSRSRQTLLDLPNPYSFSDTVTAAKSCRKSNVLTIPSVDGEGSNAVIKEGWASATPVITSDLPSNLELVTHEHDGLVFRNRDAKELATAISRIVNDPQLAQKIVKNGSETCNKFTDKAMADKYMDLYRKLMS